jgi:hypothetical protein
MQKNLFGASFFTLTGFHGTHVTIGVIWLISIFIEGVRGHVTAGQGAQLRDGGPLLALRRRGVDRDLPRRLPDELLEASWTPTATAQAHEHNFPERAWEYVKIGWSCSC